MSNEIKDISVFYGNSIIEELYIGKNKLGPKLLIKNMPSLSGIYAFQNEIIDFEFIGEFLKLKSLYIQDNPVINLDLQKLQNLENLQLFECDNLITIDFSKKTKLKQFFLLDKKVVNVISKNDSVKTFVLEKTTDSKNSPRIDSIKTAPTYKVKKGMIITPK